MELESKNGWITQTIPLDMQQNLPLRSLSHEVKLLCRGWNQLTDIENSEVEV